MEIRFPELSTTGEYTVVALRTHNGSFVRKDTVIMECKSEGGEIVKIRSTGDGVVMFAPGTKPKSKLSTGVLLVTLNACEHEIVIKDMCGTCGKNLREKDALAGQRIESATASVAMIHHVPELHISSKLAQNFGTIDKENLLKSRKLVLLVDLDQTVVHTTNRPPKFDPSQHPDITSFHLYGCQHYTKLRPHTRDFLEAMHQLFEMHIITFGARAYAHAIAKILDPEHKMFGQRILSRDEIYTHHKAGNLSSLFPCGEEMIAIIDDRADVWLFNDALLQIRPYKFFLEVDDINSPPPVVLPGQKEDEKKEKEEGNDTEKEKKEESERKEEAEENPDRLPEDNDHALEYLEKVLRDVHTAFYKRYDETGGNVWDLKVLISWLRRQVLRDCVVVLSGVVPLGVRPDRSDVYRICVQFGATVSESVTQETTHLIAARWGTEKVRDARKLGVPIVTPDWLNACVERWIKVDAKEFELTRDSEPTPHTPLGSNVVPDLANLPTMAKGTLADMANEVDAALSEEDDEDEEEKEKEVKKEEVSPKRKRIPELDDPEDSDEYTKRFRGDEDGGPEEDIEDEQDPDEIDSNDERAAVDYNDDDEATRDTIDADGEDDEDFDEMAADIEHRLTED